MNRIRNISPHWFVINLILIAWYFYVFSHLKTGISSEIMYSSSDAKSYMDVANWMASGVDSPFVEHRPVLFPLILLFLSKLGGVFLIWFFQFVLWIVSINLIFASIKRVTSNAVYGYIGVAIIGVNLSLITLTLHALTEITSIFLLSVLLFFFLKNIERRKELYFIHRIVLLFVLLTLIKPVFYLPLLFILLLIIPGFYFKKYRKSPIKLLSLVLVLIPLLVQVGIMKVKYDSYSVSNISGRTFTNYLFAKGIQEIEGVERGESMDLSAGYEMEEKKDYFIKHIDVYNSIFWRNVEENIKGQSTFLVFPLGYEKPNLAKKMLTMNKVYFVLHIIFLPLSLFLFILLLRRKMKSEAMILTCLTGMYVYYIAVTGISFFQGDRLVIAAIPVWLVSYLFIVGCYVKFLLLKKEQQTI